MNAVWLVASRELTTRVRQKSFVVSSLVLLVLVVASVAAAGLLGGGRESSATRIGLTPSATTLAAAVVAAGEAMGAPIEPVPVPADADASTLDEAGVTAIVRLTDAGTVHALVHESLAATVTAALTTAAQQAVLAGQVTALGGDPAQVAAALAAAGVEVEATDPPEAVDPARLVTAFALGMLLYMALVFGGQMIAQGVVEEKASRIIELLLATMRPWQLLAGKTLGIGLLGLGQVLLVVVGALVTADLTGLTDSYDLPLGQIAVSGTVWFLVGYATYAVLMAGLAAMVSRQEEIGSVITPVLLLLVVPYLLAVTIAPSDPTSPLVAVGSWLPFFAPLLMPVRVALGAAGPAAELGALAVNLAVLPGLVWFAGRVYRNSVLRTGARVPLREALRGARAGRELGRSARR